jgi:hypothetical protein
MRRLYRVSGDVGQQLRGGIEREGFAIIERAVVTGRFPVAFASCAIRAYHL